MRRDSRCRASRWKAAMHTITLLLPQVFDKNFCPAVGGRCTLRALAAKVAAVSKIFPAQEMRQNRGCHPECAAKAARCCSARMKLPLRVRRH